MRPAELLPSLLRADPAAPRLTSYDDLPGPTAGERIELSARVLGNWVAKAANALQEEWEVGPQVAVRPDLRPHWRGLYWSLATWACGGAVSFDAARGPRLVVTDDRRWLEDPRAESLVWLTRASLARSADVPGSELAAIGAFDDAGDLATFPDQFDAYEQPIDTDPAWFDPDEGTAESAADRPALEQRALGHGGLVQALSARVPPITPGARVLVTPADMATLLTACVAVWSGGGSVVAQLGPVDPQTLDDRARAEGVDLIL